MWNSIRADEFCESVRDGTHDTPKQQSFGYKLVTSKHIQDGLIQPDDAYYISEDDYKKINERSKVEKWDVLMAMIGNGLGRSAIVESNPDYAIKNIALFKMGGNEVKAKWLHYFLSTNYTQQVIINYLQGTGQPFLSLSLLRKFKVPNPPLPTQQKIASILSAYDNLIQNYKKQIEALQTAASELYKEWFVRFRFPGYQTTKFENGIPEGWKIVRFNEIAELINGRAYLMPELQETGKYRIVRVGNFSGKDEWFYSDMELEDNKYCESGDLLYKWACNFGPEIWNEEKVIYHYHIWKVIPNKNNMKKMFLYHLLNFSTPQWLGGTNGTAMVHITKESMEKKRIVLPSFELINEFDIFAENLNKRCRILEQQITNLTQQRDLLLPRLMSGKIEIK